MNVCLTVYLDVYVFDGLCIFKCLYMRLNMCVCVCGCVCSCASV